MTAKLTPEQALRWLWQLGVLDHKLRDYQRETYDEVHRWIADPTCLKGALALGRRFGKSTILLLVANEIARRVPEAMIRAGAPTQVGLRKIIHPLQRKLLSDCPRDLRPVWRSQDKMYVYPNGSELHLSGLNDGNADNLRGTYAHLALIDEGGYVDELDYAIGDVLTPQLLDVGGTLIVSSTPPPSPAHAFVEVFNELKTKGRAIHKTIHDTDYPKHVIDEFAASAGGYESSRWKREYLARFVIDESLAIVPEWREAYVGEPEQTELSGFWHRYEAMDIGFRDNTVVIFGRYNFRRATLEIEDEIVLNGVEVTTGKLANAIVAKEAGLKYEKVYRRIGDSSDQNFKIDLGAMHGLPFFATSKEALPAMINRLRMLVSQGRVKVHPRCTNLIACLKNGVWRNDRSIGKDFGRARGLGHYDALAALIYLVRNLDETSNPVPGIYGISPSTHYIPRSIEQRLDEANDSVRALKNVFKFQRGPRRGR